MSAPSGAPFAFPRLSRERLDAVLPRFLDDAAYGSRGLVLAVAAARARRLR